MPLPFAKKQKQGRAAARGRAARPPPPTARAWWAPPPPPSPAARARAAVATLRVAVVTGWRAASRLPPALAPLTAAAVSRLPPALAPLTAAAAAAAATADAALAPLRPWQACAAGAGAAGAAALLLWLAAGLASAIRRAGGAAKLALAAGERWVPPIAAELDAVRARVRAAVPPRPPALGPPRTALPASGEAASSILKALRAAAAGDGVRLADGPAVRASGTLYLPPGGDHARLLSDAYAAYAHANPMHASAFPASLALERDLLGMTASLVGGGGDASVGGLVTSGGTESILTAVLSARNVAAASRRCLVASTLAGPGARLQIVLASSAHPAFLKAANMFGLEPRVVPVRPDGRFHAADAAAAITARTALVVASAVSYPHGALDDVAGIAAAAAAAGVAVHVDACLGGFVLAFSPTRLPPWGFDAGPAVASVSADPHKFGLSHKGVSCCLFRGEARRRAAMTAVTDWPGGLYVSPGLPGSRSGALVAAAYASLVHQGRAGLASHAAAVYGAVRTVVAGLAAPPLAPDLAVLGVPAGPVVAFAARDPSSLNVWRVNDALSAKGWRLSALANPPALHMCFTPASVGCADALVADLAAAVAAVKEQGAAKADGGGGGGDDADGAMAPVYGQAASAGGSALGRAGVAAFLELYQDALATAR